jgi:transposase-like protein
MSEMDKAAFANWLAEIGLLNPAQRGRTYYALALAEANNPIECLDDGIGAGLAGDLPEAAPRRVTEKAVSATEPAPAKIGDQTLLSKVGQDRIANFGCPHCGGDGVHRWGSASGKPRYRCTSCRKTFNPVTGTPLAGLHRPERWNDQAAALISGESLALAAKRCDVDPSTAFRWRHRFLAALNLDKPSSLSGLVEADETFILESFKGKRKDLPRKSRKRGGKGSKRGLSAEQIPVIVARDRTGATMDAVLPRLDAVSMTAALGNTITRPAELCCDGGSAITAFARRARIKFHILPAPGLPKPEAPDIHINNVNAYHGRLKEWMRHFHGVATQNLPSYLSWRRTIEALGSRSTPEAWIMGAAGMGPYLQASR